MTEKKKIRKYAVIGDPIKHSLSPQMHNAAFNALGIDAEYLAIQVRDSELAEFTDEARNNLCGFNVTIPHKNSIIPYLDDISTECGLSGSVNTVTNKNGFLYGESTDGYGLGTAIGEEFGIPTKGTKFLFVGCGGTVRAVAFYLLEHGAGGLFFANRTVSKAELLVKALCERYPNSILDCSPLNDGNKLKRLISQTSVIIQATSLGLKPGDASPLPPDLLRPELCIYDIIYGETAFLSSARRKGCKTADGRSMLLHQGAQAFSIWTGMDAPIDCMRVALNKAFLLRQPA